MGRDAVPDAFYSNLLTDPHKEGTACRKCSDDHDDIEGIELFKEALPPEADRHYRRLKKCEADCHVPCDHRDLF